MEVKTEKTLIIIPTFNEVLNILDIYSKIRKWDKNKDILFVDDNSSDGTRQVVDKIMKDDKKVHILKHSKKEGIAQAYIAGFLWGINSGYDWFQQMDADLSHDPAYLANFEALKKENQVVIASRYMQKGGIEKWDLFRKLLSSLGCRYLRLLLQCPLTDLTGGFNCWHKEVISSFDLSKIASRGFIFQTEIKFMAYRKGFKISEFPYSFKEREKGRSKIDYHIILEGLLMPFFIRWNHRI